MQEAGKQAGSDSPEGWAVLEPGQANPVRGAPGSLKTADWLAARGSMHGWDMPP
jgi:hypothetical protein